MKSFLAIVVVFAILAVVSGFISHDHSHGHDYEANDGEEGHHHHHHHHHGKHRKHHHGHHHWKCNGEAVNSNADLIKAKKECHQEFKEDKDNNVENRQRGRTCKSLCAAEKIGIINEGQIVQHKLDDLVDSMIESTEAQSQIKKKAHVCAKNATELIEDGPSDNKCSNYKAYFKCLWMSTMEVCTKDFDREDWE